MYAKQNKTKFDFKFGKKRYSLYRVWCLKELRDRYNKVEEKENSSGNSSKKLMLNLMR